MTFNGIRWDLVRSNGIYIMISHNLNVMGMNGI